MPSESAHYFETFFKSYTELSNERHIDSNIQINHVLHPVDPNVEFEMEINKRKMIIRSINCDHNRSCRAYAFYECRKKLKEEY